MTDSHPDGSEPEVTIEQLLELLEAQRVECERLVGHSDEQARLVGAADAQSLLTVLAARQGCVDRLGRLGESLAPFRRGWDRIVAGMSASQRRRVGELVSEVDRLMSQVRQRDEHDWATLSERRDRVAADLGRVRQGRSATAAYGKPIGAGVDPRYTDREC